jgi:hypothetical protein
LGTPENTGSHPGSLKIILADSAQRRLQKRSPANKIPTPRAQYPAELAGEGINGSPSLDAGPSTEGVIVPVSEAVAEAAEEGLASAAAAAAAAGEAAGAALSAAKKMFSGWGASLAGALGQKAEGGAEH